MKTSLRVLFAIFRVSSFSRLLAHAQPAMCQATRVMICLALIFAIAPCSAATRRAPRAAGNVLSLGYNYYGQLGDGTNTDRHAPVQVSDFPNAIAIAGSGWHSLALKSDGTVWAWGYNADGRLGDGTTTDRYTPVRVLGLSGVVAIAGGGYHSLALRSDGTVWAWGANNHNQLGDGTSTNRSTPVQVSGLSGIVAIAGAGWHSLALKSDGTVWTWGANNYGQLGDDSTTDRSTPVQVSGLSGVTAIAGGWMHSLAVKSDGTAWAWGQNDHSQLGNGDTTDRHTPVPVPGLSGVVEVSGGYYHSLARKSDGTVWAWGYNARGQLGDTTTTNRSTPVQVSGLTGAIAVVGHDYQSLALRSDGAVWAWGDNFYGELGDGTTTNRSTAQPVSGLTGVVTIGAGSGFSLALQSQAVGAAWGDNENGRLGNGTTTNSSTPTAVTALTGLAAIAAGGFHSVAVKSGGTVWTWGLNGYGEMGVGSGVTESSTPVQVTSGFTAPVVAIAAGEHHVLALQSDGTVWAWGHNENGQCGTGTPGVIYTPLQVSGLSGVAAIAAGAYFSLALKSDGTVWSWGTNDFGQLGNGTTNPTSTPVQVMSGGTPFSGVVAIAGGAWHSLALKSDGTVWAWGRNNSGQLGNNSTSDSSTPVQVMNLSGVVAIAAGGQHNLALKSDGTVWAWGNNAIGQLGNGGIVGAPPSLTPVAVGSLSGVVTIATGRDHSLALKSDGTVWAWGDNGLGEVGDGTTITPRSTPLQVSGLQGPSAISGALYHTLALALSPTVPAGTTSVTITASDWTVTYGSAPPVPLPYTVNPSVKLDTLPWCHASATAASGVGDYAITCEGAVSGLYGIAYLPGNLRVNPASLAVAADNKSMGQGSAVPTLTANYFGFVNGDTPAVLSGAPYLHTDASSSSSPGTYPITVAQGTLSAANYSFGGFTPGTLTVNAGLLNSYNNYFVTGNFAYGATNLRGLGDGTGFANQTVPILDANADPNNGVPAGADIVAAVLYWQAVEDPSTAAGSHGFFRGYSITGEVLGSDLAYTANGIAGVMRMYRANVLPYLALDAQGRRVAVDNHAVRLPDGGAGPALPANSGAILVIVYRVLSTNFPLRSVVIYDGAWVKTDGYAQSVGGFYDAVRTEAKILFMSSTDGGPSSVFDPHHSLPGGTGTLDRFDASYPAAYGTSGGALVVSVPVNDSDNDGLLDAWESGQGYYDVKDNSWVPLPGAINGQRDLFVQLDYMCSRVNGGACDTSTGQHTHLPDVGILQTVADAFSAHNIRVHFDVGNNYQGLTFIVPYPGAALGGNIIAEETCVDDPNASPPRVCQFPNEPGVVGWKAGLELAKIWPHDAAGCAAGGDCSPRFPHGRKDSWHYVLLGHSLGIAAWNTRWGTINSISISNGTGTITTPHRGFVAGTNNPVCPERITISGALGAPALNGLYRNITCPDDATLQFSAQNVGTWSYTKPADPKLETEPLLAIVSGTISSISGYSDLGGADSAVTLGKWETDPNQDMSKKPNVQAGTLMHEIGHTLGLTHGGAYSQSDTYAMSFEANCKPNYQSVMNYMFQIDLLGANHNIVDYSTQTLPTLAETLSGPQWALPPTPAINTTAWYRGTTNDSEAATRHCDGTPLLPGEKMVRVYDDMTNLASSGVQDINFDGKGDGVFQGYDDWSNIDLRQVGATGGELASMEGIITFGSGGTVTLGSGGTVALGSGGTVTLGSGGTITLGSGGTVTLGSGGTVTLGSGGTITLGSGGTVTLGSGGLITLGSGGTVILGSGGTVTLGSGGSITLDSSGGTVILGSGGTVALGSGGIVTLGSGGTIAMGSGGTVALGSGGTVTLGSGGIITLGSGGTVTLGSGGSGGIVTLGSGGIVALGSAGIVALGSGGIVPLGSGGTVVLGSGGIVSLGSGGIVAMGSGGTVTLGSGGPVVMGSGGIVSLGSGGTGLSELTYEDANSIVRPPTNLTITQIDNNVRLDWTAPVFGVIREYRITRTAPDGTVTTITLSGGPPPTTYTDTLVPGATYMVTTTVQPDPGSTTPRQSPPVGKPGPKPQATVTPGSIDFGTVYLGAIVTRSVTVASTGTLPLTISDPFIWIVPGGNSKEFVAINLCPRSLAVGKSCKITVSFVALPLYTPQTATLKIVDSALDSPQSVPLTARVINPWATLSTQSLSFGTQKVNTSSTAKAVTLKNSGNTPLTITSINMDGKNPLDFTQTSDCPGSLAPRAACTIKVTFKPTATGSRSGKVVITDNALTSPQTISLSGTGK